MSRESLHTITQGRSGDVFFHDRVFRRSGIAEFSMIQVSPVWCHPPQCQVLTSHQKSLTTSSTSYTVNAKPSKSVASSLNHGFHVPEVTFSVKSPSILVTASGLGKSLSPVLLILLHVISALCPSVTHRPISKQLQNGVVGFRCFQTLYS